MDSSFPGGFSDDAVVVHALAPVCFGLLYQCVSGIASGLRKISKFLRKWRQKRLIKRAKFAKIS